MAKHGISSLDSIIAEARSMQETGRYINGTVFHAMAEAIAENKETIAALAFALEPFAKFGIESRALDANWVKLSYARGDLGVLTLKEFNDARAALALARGGK